MLKLFLNAIVGFLVKLAIGHRDRLAAEAAMREIGSRTAAIEATREAEAQEAAGRAAADAVPADDLSDDGFMRKD